MSLQRKLLPIFYNTWSPTILVHSFVSWKAKLNLIFFLLALFCIMMASIYAENIKDVGHANVCTYGFSTGVDYLCMRRFV
jgi:hypothetical protein